MGKALGKFRGYNIEKTNENNIVFSDTKQLVSKTWKDRPCGACEKFNTREDHDACLGSLPGVLNACCGHGDADSAYVQFVDGAYLSGEAADQWVKPFKSNRL